MAELPVAAIVVNLDGGPMLDACLDALEGERPAVLLVVDNGSAAAEVERLSRRPGITLVPLPENRGFAGPANLGARAALAVRRVPYLAFLNNDCVLAPGYLAALVAALEGDAGLVAVQGAVLDEAGERVDGCGVGWNARGEAVQLRRGEAPPAEAEPLLAVPGVSATAAVYRADAFLSAGGFEETFFAYYEDVDLALRLSRAGGRFACVPSARARHVGSATGQRSPEARWRRLFRNRLRTLRRNVKHRLRAPIVPAALRGAARDLGWGRALLTASRALAVNRAESRRDREVYEALPALAKLPT